MIKRHMQTGECGATFASLFSFLSFAACLRFNIFITMPATVPTIVKTAADEPMMIPTYSVLDCQDSSRDHAHTCNGWS